MDSFITSEKEVFPDALAARMTSPTLTSEIALTSPDCILTVSVPAKQDAVVMAATGAVVGGRVGVVEGVIVLASAEGTPAAAMKPFMAPTVLRELVSADAELDREAVTDALEAAVDTEYEIFTDEEEARSLTAVPSSSTRLRLAVTDVIAVTVTALAAMPSAAAVEVMKAV